MLFFDGRSLEPLDLIPDFALTEFRWHPTRPAEAIYVGGNELGYWNIDSRQRRVIARFDQYPDIGIGPWEGNPSDDGQWLVVAGGLDPVQEVFVMNLQSGQRHATIAHGFSVVDFATISPSGRYVLVNGWIANGQTPLYDRTRIFDRNGNLVGSWLEYGRPSHFDLTLDADGEDIAVGVSKSPPDEGSVIARRLLDGSVRRLTSGGYAWHTSARNTRTRGTVASSFAANAPAWGPWSDLMLIVSTGLLDDIQVAGKQYAVYPDYWGEPQPVISPDGRMLLWARAEGSTVMPYLTIVSDELPAVSAHAIQRCSNDG